MEEVSKPRQDKPVKGPGEILAETRLKLGLEPDNVAQILHLSRLQIEALEANDFDNLPEPTYVRGYLRSYSQLLNIDPQPVIDSYNDAIGGWKSTTYSGLAVERQISSNDNLIRFATLGVIGVVFGLAVVWWLGEDETPTAVPIPAEVVPAINNDNLNAPATENSSNENTPVVAAPGEAVISENSISITPVGPTAVPKPVNTQTLPLIRNVQTHPFTESRPMASETITATAVTSVVGNGTRAKLVLRTNGPSWADIRDANDNKLLYETVPAGRVITVEGEAPLQVFLGNANVVSLELDGVEYNFDQFTRGLTARFSVGGVDAGSSE
ncbi:MAG: RodZ domain-containing protein [Acidiferrobacterales bacterium]